MNKKRILSLFLALVMVFSVAAATSPSALAVDVSNVSVVVNGSTYAFSAYNIGGNNYFKLRDLAYTLSGSDKQFNVSWDGNKDAILLTTGQAYTVVGNEMVSTATAELRYCYPSSATVYLNGAEISLSAYYINDNNYFKLRDLMEALDIGVGWDDATRTISVDTSQRYISNAKAALSVEDVVAENIDAVLMLYGYNGKDEQISQGSGFFISSDGQIASNYHVIEGVSTLKAVTNGGTEYKVSIVLAYNVLDDMVVLQAENAKNVAYSVLGDSDTLEIGEQVVAIGSPHGFMNTVTTGIISAFRGTPELRSEDVTDIQTTAAMSSGNSGGPLYNMYGEVVGINYASYSVGQQLNFSIPINELKAMLGNLSSYKLTDVSLLAWAA